MSAYVVDKTHIDAMLSAGLNRVWRQGGDVRWFDAPEPVTNYEEGQFWGPQWITWSNDHLRELTDETAGRVGAMLWAENRRSVNHRYAEDEWEAPYVFDKLPGTPDPLTVLMAINCYEYQSCEHPGWHVSESYRFCDALRRKAIQELPGYGDADGWGIRDRNIFLMRQMLD